MGYLKEKGIFLCTLCGQLHGVDYDCSKPKSVQTVQPVKSGFPRLVDGREFRPVGPGEKSWAWQEPLDLQPEQELLLRMELGEVTLLRQVGGVQIILDAKGERSSSRGSGTGQSFTLNHDQFAQILDHTLNGEPMDGWSILLALCSLSVLVFSFFVFFM